MILEIITYGHPALRAVGQEVKVVDDSIRKLAADMIETINQMEGVAGLAAQQVGSPWQMFVLNVVQWEERPSTMWKDGKSVAFDHLMPLVVLNAEIETEGEIASEGEGCFSFPGVFGAVARPERVHLRAKNLEGESIDFSAEGLLSRAIQHEFDHTHGILFIDRMDKETRQELEPLVSALNPQHRFL